MQDKYVCDIGDFGKFFLFRKIFTGNKKLAIIWFYHKIVENNKDGKYIEYFHRVTGLDCTLENAFKKILLNNNRNIKALQELNLLNNAIYFNKELNLNREVWFKDALNFVKDANIVSVAPDNGIAVKCNKKEQSLSIVAHHKSKTNAHKYIFKDEIVQLFNLKHLEILILYWHLNRCFKHNLQIELILKELKKEFEYLVAIKHKPYSPRVYIFIFKDKKASFEIGKKLKNFADLFSHDWEFFAC